MAQFKVEVTIIVEADDDSEAYHVAQASAENMQGGAIAEVQMGSVTEL